MRLYDFVLVVVLVLLASFDPASAFKNSKLTIPGNLRESNTPGTRFLRDTPIEDKDQERGFSLKNNLLVRLVANKRKEAQVLKALQGKSIKQAFKTAKLNDIRITDAKGSLVKEKVTAFFSSPEFKAWSKHTANVYSKDPNVAMLSILKDNLGTDRVVKMIIMSADSKRAGKVVQKLETAQFNEYRWNHFWS
ncbi:RxLR effector protein [Phytophthora megakarya]|uniref:RxLR effector protein n=1 Tax=Phytophthora megakarya TaxID=4795 RepID=A0A225VL84_9STRA|nr:RxLR effector protein [Phytophthora megakarya]